MRKQDILFFTLAIASLNCSSSSKQGIKIVPKANEHLSSKLGEYNLGNKINSTTDDYAPKMIGSTLIYSSGITVDGKYPKALEAELFRSDYDSKTSIWSDPTLIGAIPMQGKSLNLNEGAMDILPDQEYAVFAAEKIIGKSGQSSLMDLYEVKFDAKNFKALSEPVPIDAVNDPDAWDSQPALSKDGKTLFFVSDRPISPNTVRGNMHIYRSDKVSGKWSSPKILPPPYATNGNDVTPYVGTDGYFYFSSNGNPDGKAAPEGLGKRDIYKVKFINDSLIGIPIRLPAPFNSSSDDDFPSLTSDCRTMLLASDREGGAGKRDIYAFPIPATIRLKGKITHTVIKDSKQLDPVPFSSIEVNATDKTDPAMMLKDTTNDRGEYSIFLQEDHQYDVTVSKPSCLDPVAPGFVNAMRNCTDTTDYTQNFNIIDKSFTITLGKESNIPYFITGYWRPNTPENLVVFMKRDSTESKFHNIVYLNSGDYDYHSASLKIADILDQRVYKPIIHIVHTRLSEDCQGTKKILHIHVDGFTDKRTITPGDYLDENVPAVNGEPEIHNGDQMSDRFMQGKSQIGNRMLSHLRAYWTMVDVREHLRKQDQVCAELIEKGRITFDFKGNGIDDSITQNDAFNRRVDITASIE